ncbi:MAG: O-antigen ligase family protein [Actinomycetota bacterium]
MSLRPRPGPRLALPALGALLSAAAFLQGGFHLPQLVPLTTAAFVAACLTFTGRIDRGVLTGFCALAAALVTSAAANGFPDQAIKPALTLVFCVSVFVVADQARSREGSDTVLDAVTGVALVVAALGLIGVVFHLDAWAFRDRAWRLASTLTYQNAAAALFAVALPAALARAAESAMARLAAVLLTVSLAATQSRAGAMAAVLGIATLAALSGIQRAWLRVALGAMIAGGSMAPSLTGSGYRQTIAVAGIGLGCWVAASRREVGGARATAVLTAVAAAAVVLAVATLSTPLRDRLSAWSNDRTRVWTETIERVDEHPVFGTGPGTYRLVTQQNGSRLTVLHAHNEYIQVTAETGLAGLAGVLAAIALIGRALWRARPRNADPHWAAAAGAGVAFLAHSGFDFLWRVPVLPAIAFVLLAAGLGARPRA